MAANVLVCAESKSFGFPFGHLKTCFSTAGLGYHLQTMMHQLEGCQDISNAQVLTPPMNLTVF